MSDADAGPVGLPDANGSRTRPGPAEPLTSRVESPHGETVRIDPFDMERMQSTWENVVEINLSESGVHPMTLRELLREDDRMEAFLDSPAAYSQSNGTPELRPIPADHYRGATPDHLLVTCGSSE